MIHLITALITTGLLGALEIYALQQDSHYKYDFLVLMAGLWILYAARRQLHVHPSHFALWSVFLIAHNLGVFGTYDHHFFGIEYDYYVHLLFGFVAGLIAMRWLHSFQHRRLLYIGLPLAILVLSGAHELLEVISSNVVGEGEGVFRFGPGDLGNYDTATDLTNNVLGSVVGIVSYALYEKWHGAASTKKVIAGTAPEAAKQDQ